MKKIYAAILFAALFVLAVYTEGHAQMAAQATWQDNSNNEDGFILQVAIGSGGFQEIGRTAANVTTFTHDVSAIPAGTVLTYRVGAFNVVGVAWDATGAKFTVPSVVVPPPSPTLPVPPGAVGITWVCQIGFKYDAAKNACVP